jgi:hypothetical protein
MRAEPVYPAPRRGKEGIMARRSAPPAASPRTRDPAEEFAARITAEFARRYRVQKLVLAGIALAFAVVFVAALANITAVKHADQARAAAEARVGTS